MSNRKQPSQGLAIPMAAKPIQRKAKYKVTLSDETIEEQISLTPILSSAGDLILPSNDVPVVIYAVGTWKRLDIIPEGAGNKKVQ